MPAHQEAAHWTIADLDFSRIDLDAVRNDETLFYLACSASFVESGSDMYTRNLIEYFQGDAEVTQWLSAHWEAEELQHGQALRAYVQHVWPEFDWEPAYRDFLAEYAGYCKVELLAPSRALEMSARCVVETGTATYYRALARATTEPVFIDLALRIAADEVSHYKHFYRFFRRYRDQERVGRTRVFGTVAHRIWALRSEDADCALRHIASHRDPACAGDKAWLRRLTSRVSRTVSRNLNPQFTLKMLMRPLDLPPRLESMLRVPVEQFMQRLFLR
ncbi:ferritin-like domain-containing protein [Xylophilus sp.]|uniref:ferritin-like domain-containing protein n=1 Tax=Xylophilus sp. TaxID=2653893 RepID=UPI0013BB75A0|nr:ferritin-like domain-containing protein [Xylophilus sp.]KAF1048698.1 MAG: hypothetical protein GAK38_01142 [Xylophilus sp.]